MSNTVDSIRLSPCLCNGDKILLSQLKIRIMLCAECGAPDPETVDLLNSIVILKPGEDVCYSNDKTVNKVYNRLYVACGLSRVKTSEAMRALQNAGILFRENRRG